MGSFVCGTLKLRLATDTLLLKPVELFKVSVKFASRFLAALLAVAALTFTDFYGSCGAF